MKPGFFTLVYQQNAHIYLVFEDFQFEFHAELKNELFVQGHHI